MTGPVTGLTRKTWLKAESTYDTVSAFAATDAVDLLDLKIEPEKTHEEISSHIGTASLQGHIPGDQDNKWSLESYARPGAAGVAPDIGPLLTHLFGTETIVGGTSVTYEPSDALITAGLQIALYGGPNGEVYEVANGCWAEQFSIDAKRGEGIKLSASGGFASYGMAKQGGIVDAIEPIGESVIQLEAGQAACFRPNAVVKFDTEDNGGAGYTITAVDYTNDTITVTPVLVGATEDGDVVYPVVPSQTLTGTPIGGVSNSLTLGGTSVKLIDAKIDVATGIKPRRDSTSDVPVGLLGPGPRRITGEVSFYELNTNTVKTGLAWDDDSASMAINFRFGPNAAAKRLKVEMPSCLCKVVGTEDSDEDGRIVTLSFIAQQSAAAKDEIDFIFD